MRPQAVIQRVGRLRATREHDITRSKATRAVSTARGEGRSMLDIKTTQGHGPIDESGGLLAPHSTMSVVSREVAMKTTHHDVTSGHYREVRIFAAMTSMVHVYHELSTF